MWICIKHKQKVKALLHLFQHVKEKEIVFRCEIKCFHWASVLIPALQTYESVFWLIQNYSAEPLTETLLFLLFKVQSYENTSLVRHVYEFGLFLSPGIAF